MSPYDVAVVGTGPNPSDPSVESFAMAYRHAEAYERRDDCQLVAATDRHANRVAAFGDRFDVPVLEIQDGLFKTMAQA
ncbi:hypothetical protein [Halorhabdus rudnickae]|uniref:hypothetical protein n=1 Tax=Halorhabdus rudnickae TaxID=1775544 RepID=UPI001AEF8A01